MDFKSGYRWPASVPYFRCQPKVGADIKLPWELSRFHHAVTLGLAWQCTGDRAYAEELARQIDDWIRANPVGYGVNWACTMDVAIRAVNWLAGAALLAEIWTEEAFRAFRARFNTALWQHARFIITHLEWNGPHAGDGANHLLADLTGLLTLGRFFDDTRAGTVWYHFAYRELERQIQLQVLPDGVHFERSPSYHRLCLEMFLWCGALAANAGHPFSPIYADRIQKMQQFVADYMKPSGVAPLIGDNDDGRLLNAGLLPVGDHRYLLPASEPVGRFYMERILLDGSSTVTSESRRQSSAYPKGGFYILRNRRAYVIIRAGELGPKGAHAHNDQLSFELNLDGRDIIVDPGTFVYTSDPAARNRLRSTNAHNALQLNEVEQNPFNVDVFGLPDCTQTKVKHWDAVSLEGWHHGFPKLARKKFRIWRRIILDLSELRITDSGDDLRAGDRFHWRFVLPPGLVAESAGLSVRISESGVLYCSLTPPSGADVASEPFIYSPSYGIQQNTSSIVVQCTVTDPAATWTTRIRWEPQ